MNRIQAPFAMYGGKHYLLDILLPLLPPHQTYVEVFGGGAWLLLNKRPSPVEVYNDIDRGLVGFYRILRDPAKFEQLLLKLELTPYSREEFYDCRDHWHEEADDIERAARWYVWATGAFSGYPNRSWSNAVTTSRRGMSARVSSYLSHLEHLPAVHQRLRRVQIENLDFREAIGLYDGKGTVLYLDPPYIDETRSFFVYCQELALEDHRDLVRILLSLKGMAILSGYDHEIYRPLVEAEWEKITVSAHCHAIGRVRGSGLVGEGNLAEIGKRVECIWLSPNINQRQLNLWSPDGARELNIREIGDQPSTTPD